MQKRTIDDTESLNRLLSQTPSLDKGGPDMFRNLGDNGKTYSKYLQFGVLSIFRNNFICRIFVPFDNVDKYFCNCIFYEFNKNILESHHSFQIAFTLFDEDENLQIDKNEFLKV